MTKNNKVILITGSTDGIGKLAAIKLAKEGHSVYLHGRTEEKLQRVIDEVKAESNNHNVDGFIADFSDLRAVTSMANEVLEKLPSIDVLINNAGIFKTTNVQTSQGLDIRFAVNYFAPYVLTQALLPLLQKASGSRVINLSSAAQATVENNSLVGQLSLNDNAAYAQSKLALTMWSFYLAKRTNNPLVIAVNPGSLLNTNMVKEAYGHHWSSADKGANILYDLAISEEYDNVTGKYFDNDAGDEKGRFGDAHADAYNEKLISELIQTTAECLDSVM